MTLCLEYRAETTVPVEIEGILPESVRDQSLAEIEQTPVFHGNRQLPLAEFFRISGDPRDERFELSGNLAGVHWIGAKMTRGSIHVVGHAGRHLGSEMRGGEIHVDGDSGDWVGGELRGGLIHVRGRAGHLIGSAYRGSAKGMSGGTIIIGGDVGNECGHSMRRGLLVVGGACGDFIGLNMIAGTAMVFGGCGIRPAAGMRRGSLVLFNSQPPLLPTFRRDGLCRPAFMRLYLLHLRRLGVAVADEWLEADFLSFGGDLLTVGRGEILIRQ